jgi:ATP-dependent 26S proteasome regulatory subunit
MDPGAGKTSLVKAFAEAMKLSMIHGNITQMLHRGELLHLFDDIAAQQAKDTMPIMVFVDEINALS